MLRVGKKRDGSELGLQFAAIPFVFPTSTTSAAAAPSEQTRQERRERACLSRFLPLSRFFRHP
jgi:hypothetical protein